MIHEKLLAQINALFSPHPEVIDFLILHNNFVHAVDDVIDVKEQPSEQKLDAFLLAYKYYNHPVYQRNKESMMTASLLHHIAYRDSVIWEESDNEFLSNSAKSLRHASFDIFILCVALYFGPEKAQELSTKMREYTFFKHKDD